MNVMRWGIYLIFVMIASACGDAATFAPSDDSGGDSIASSGQWLLEYTENCANRASRLLDVTVTDETLVFDDYTLTLDDRGDYVGNKGFSIYLESCRHDVLFNYEYSLKQVDETTFSGSESITEIGVGTEICPIRLIQVDES